MSGYTVKFYPAESERMDYRERQRAANRDRAICYLEHHLNWAGRPEAKYCAAIVGTNASNTSMRWGAEYCQLVKEFTGAPIYRWGAGPQFEGVAVGGIVKGRGNYNVYHTAMPAILVEPFFASNPEQVKALQEGEGIYALAQAINESIRLIFPDGGLVAFSIGHRGKKSSPKDEGVIAVDGISEAEYSSRILTQAKELLET